MATLSNRCSMLWIGPSLGAIERACMRSVLRHGHSLTLFSYSVPIGVPQGVELRDAAEIIPESEIVRHRTGSVSLFSNRFRYELLRRDLGIWLDCDAYLLAPVDQTSGHVLGEEEPGRLGTGVLRLPPDSPALPQLLELFDERSIPPWLPVRHKVPAYWRLWKSGRAGLSQMPWGTAGPKALTAIAREHNLIQLAVPADVFYPVRWQDADWILDPSISLASVITQRTISIHLWNERIKHFKDKPAPRGSFLERLQEEGRP